MKTVRAKTNRRKLREQINTWNHYLNSSVPYRTKQCNYQKALLKATTFLHVKKKNIYMNNSMSYVKPVTKKPLSAVKQSPVKSPFFTKKHEDPFTMV